MAGGRPRTVSPPPEDFIALGEEMLDWLDKHPETLHLSEWYTIHKMYTYNQWKQFIAKPEFHPYYETALKIVGKHYLNKDSPVNPSISQRWQRVYFKDLREQEDEDARFNSELKKSELDTKTEQYQQANAKLDKVLDHFSSLQSDLKISDNKAINDQKS